MTVIAVDVSGGDFGARTTMPASMRFIAAHPHVSVIFVGKQTDIEPYIETLSSAERARIEIVHAEQIVDMDEKPVQALRSKRQSSMRKAIELVSEGRADICVSAGNTGALMAMSHMVLKPIEGIDRPAILGVFPAPYDGEVYLLDLGANVAASAQHLYQFALLAAAIFSRNGNPAPRVALLNVGHESTKGTTVVQEAAALLEGAEHLIYSGFVEGHDIFHNKADIIVCDGFTGNVMLKACEGMVHLLYQKMINELKRHKIFSFIMGPILKKIVRNTFLEYSTDHKSGALFVGLNGLVVKSHGGANDKAFENALDFALRTASGFSLSAYAEKVKRQLTNIEEV